MSTIAGRTFPSGASVDLELVDHIDGFIGYPLELFPAEKFVLEHLEEPKVDVFILLAAIVDGKPLELRCRKAQ